MSENGSKAEHEERKEDEDHASYLAVPVSTTRPKISGSNSPRSLKIPTVTVSTASDGRRSESSAGQTHSELSPVRQPSTSQQATQIVSQRSADSNVQKAKSSKKSLDALPGKKKRVDVAASSLERNFITLERALSDFHLQPGDLEGLPRTTRRSPFAHHSVIEVLWRKDVVARSVQVWGSLERLRLEHDRRRRDVSRDHLSRRQPRDKRKQEEDRWRDLGLRGSSGRVIVLAIAVSVSLKSLRPSSEHPYGYSSMKFVAALISGVGIFCVGTGLSLYHGVVGLVAKAELEDLTWAFVVMGVSGVSEMITLVLAVRSLYRSAKEKKVSLLQFIRTSQDPGVNVVLTEDVASVLSLGVAAACLALSDYTCSPIPDAVGSLLIGLVLAAVAYFIISSNAGRLVGRSIPKEQLERINAELEGDVMVRAIHDVKGIDMGNYMVHYKAELDFDGRELTRAYLDAVDMAHLLETVQAIRNGDDLESFMLGHGENIVDMLGGQIDRIERKLRACDPCIRHCDLEIL